LYSGAEDRAFTKLAMRPCEEVAGDALNLFPLRDGHIGD
jgi:hypothetical protein